MNKLIAYFKNGKGYGLKAILVFSVFIAVLLWGMTYSILYSVPNNPDLNQFLNQLPAITIQDGQVITPAHANTAYSFKGHPVFYLQTDKDEVSPFSVDGFYLTRHAFSVVSDGQVRTRIPLSTNTTVTPENIMSVIRSFVLWAPILLAVFYFAILWIFYLVVVGVSALILAVTGLILKFKFDAGTIWRSASFSSIAILLLDIIMGFFGYSIGRMTYPMLFQTLAAVILVLIINIGLRQKKVVESLPKKKK